MASVHFLHRIGERESQRSGVRMLAMKILEWAPTVFCLQAIYNVHAAVYIQMDLSNNSSRDLSSGERKPRPRCFG